MGWDHSVYVRGPAWSQKRVREIAARIAKAHEGELLEREEDDGHVDVSFELAFAFGHRGGGFSVERLDRGYHLFTDKAMAGNASDDIADLMDSIGAKLGEILDEDDDIDELSDPEEEEQPLLEEALRNKALVRVEDRSGVTLGKLTLDADVVLEAIDADGKLRDLDAYPKLTQAGRASARIAKVQATLHDDYRAYRRHRWACDRDGRITEAKVEELSD